MTKSVSIKGPLTVQSAVMFIYLTDRGHHGNKEELWS